MVEEIRKKLRQLGNPEKAIFHQRFFKTGSGEYAEGDVFLGIIVPEIRKLVAQYKALPIAEAFELLESPIHEERHFALMHLVYVFSKTDEAARKTIYKNYLDHTAHINNWDLVDVSAPSIVGGYLIDKSRSPLAKLARSRSLWERRIAIVSTGYFIRKNQFEDTVKISEMLLKDKEDLIHKAVGWMLREAGKKDLAVLEGFLQKHHRVMPRTMLRYAIEKFPEARRQKYLSK